jgi:hypothetical protein
MAGASQTAASVDIFMIALVPQMEQRHRSANELAALAPQSQLVSGCFAMAFLDTPCSQNMPDHRYPLFHTYMSVFLRQ